MVSLSNHADAKLGLKPSDTGIGGAAPLRKQGLRKISNAP